MANTAAAFPFVTVAVDTSALQPVAQRSTGVIAVVGEATGGAAVVDAPTPVDTLADVATAFGTTGPLVASLKLAMLQDPKPSKIYGVKAGGANSADFKLALDALLAADDVDFVSLAMVSNVDVLLNLRQHAEQASADGHKRIGVAMVDPARLKSPTYAQDVFDTLHPAAGSDLLSTSSRIVIVAARGALAADGTSADAATAAMSAMAGYAPSTSIVLKRVRGLSIPPISQYTSTEIKALSEFNIVPLIQPALLVGGGIVFGDGRCFTSDASLLYVDIVRTLDNIDFRLKAGLLGLIGDVRVTRSGLTTVKGAVEGILGPLQRAAVIDGFGVRIPVLDILSLPENARTPTESAIVVTARANRAVDMYINVVYGPAVHSLLITLQPTF